jgi:hypothetical protein
MGYTKEQREAKKLAEIEKNKIASSNAQTEQVEKITEVFKENKQRVNIKNLPLHTSVRVRSNVFGQLIYKSKKTGYQIEWDNSITPQYFTLDELQEMRNTQRKFFERNWVIIDGFVDDELSASYSIEEILDYLHVKEYYKNFLCPENVDDLFKLPVDEIEKRLLTTSDGNKDLIVVRANELIQNGVLDSMRVILTLEKALNCELSQPTV